MRAPTVVCVSTRGDPVNLRVSAERWGFNVQVVGQGRKWLGFKSKPLWHYEEVNSDRYHPDDLVILCDAYDVLAVGPAEEFVRFFQERVEGTGRKLLMGTEVLCPYQQCVGSFAGECGVPDTTPYKYLNSGVIAGRVKDLRTLLHYVKTNVTQSDQRTTGEYLKLQPKLAYLDSQAEVISHCELGDTEQFRLRPLHNRLQRVDTHNSPIFWHAPGLQTGKRQTELYNKVARQQVKQQAEPVEWRPGQRVYRHLYSDFHSGPFHVAVLVGVSLWLLGAFYVLYRRQWSYVWVVATVPVALVTLIFLIFLWM